jgi:hypothetical protein
MLSIGNYPMIAEHVAGGKTVDLGPWTRFAVQEAQVLASLGAVVLVFASALDVLWVLRKFEGRLNAAISGGLGTGSGRLAIRAAGLMGAYLSLVAAEFLGLYIIRMLTR